MDKVDRLAEQLVERANAARAELEEEGLGETKGTNHMIGAAVRAGKPVRIVPICGCAAQQPPVQSATGL